MKMRPGMLAALTVTGLAALLVAACGGGEATATPQPPSAPTSTPRPTLTPVAPTATAPAPTRPAPTATATPRPLPTPTATPVPVAGVPTPVVLPAGKRGGTLQLRLIAGATLAAFDSYDVGGTIEFSSFGPMLNNLIWPDPYGKDLVGDTAEGWTLTEGGKVITFTLRKGIRFHDGMPLTSKDVVYNLERGLRPRDTRMTQFRARFAAIETVQAVDDSNVKVTLKAPSNVVLLAIGHPGVLMYPSHFPFPEKKDEWKKAPIGSGPFKMVKIDPAVGVEYVKNPDYFKAGVPYVDGVTMTVMTNDVAIAAFRAGRLDATVLDSSPTQFQLDALRNAHQWVPIRNIVSVNAIHLAQREPFTNPKVREAIDLAIDREALVAVWLRGGGSRLTGPLLPLELGGKWGIPSAELATQLAYHEDKTQAMARARQLLQEAEVDPGKFTLKLIGSPVFVGYAETVDGSLRSLGFKTQVDLPTTATERLLRQDFDVNVTTMSQTFDDPKDELSSFVTTGGGFNYPKWSNPKVDSLMEEQDATLDQSKRKGMILELQRIVLDENVFIPTVARFGYHGHLPRVKNFPTNSGFIFSPLFRLEQVWLDR